MVIIEELQKRLGGSIIINESLSNHTTFKIGGLAKYFFVAKTKEDVVKALQAAQELHVTYFVLSLGSNILVADKGFDGLVIQIRHTEVCVEGERIIAGAGLALARLVQTGWENSLVGLEFAAPIPGSVGGAIRGNAGAYGKSAGDFVEQVECLEDGVVKTLSRQECQFAYRESRFKKIRGVVLQAVFKLEKGDVAQAKQLVQEYMRKRVENNPMDFPSAGCVFKNLELREVTRGAEPSTLRGAGWNIPPEFSQRGKIPAAWIIENVLGLKGARIGQAQISEKHANFIINLGGAKAQDVMMLIKMVKDKAKEKIGVEMETEIELVGF